MASLTTYEIRSLFRLLSDDKIYHDPSRGTCCRNGCSGCNYLDPVSGEFVYEVYNSDAVDVDDDDESDANARGWIAPYYDLVVDGTSDTVVHASSWGRILFPPETTTTTSSSTTTTSTDRRMAVEWDIFPSLILSASSKVMEGRRERDDDEFVPSPLALKSLWHVLSPALGYPRVSSNDVSSSIRGMAGSDYAMGGAVNYASFERCMIDASDRLLRSSADVEGGEGSGGDDGVATTALDYDDMDKDELLALCATRDMNTSFPKMKRIIIEELRFYDAHGRQGKRHPVKNTLG
jgi:hypothetical protein